MEKGSHCGWARHIMIFVGHQKWLIVFVDESVIHQTLQTVIYRHTFTRLRVKFYTSLAVEGPEAGPP